MAMEFVAEAMRASHLSGAVIYLTVAIPEFACGPVPTASRAINFDLRKQAFAKWLHENILRWKSIK